MKDTIFDSNSLLKESNAQFVYQQKKAVFWQVYPRWAPILALVRATHFSWGSSPRTHPCPLSLVAKAVRGAAISTELGMCKERGFQT